MKQKQILCAYGDCQEWMEAGKGFKLTVTESSNGSVYDRQYFCCYEHAIRWLQRRDSAPNSGRRFRSSLEAFYGADEGPDNKIDFTITPTSITIWQGDSEERLIVMGRHAGLKLKAAMEREWE